MKLFSITAAAFAAVITLITGCSSYQYIPPNTESGRQCVAVCESAKQTCETGSKQAAATQQASCESRETSSLAVCLALAKDQAGKEKCTKARKSCSTYAATYQCDNSYRNCFKNCGGQIIETN